MRRLAGVWLCALALAGCQTVVVSRTPPPTLVATAAATLAPTASPSPSPSPSPTPSPSQTPSPTPSPSPTPRPLWTFATGPLGARAGEAFSCAPDVADPSTYVAKVREETVLLLQLLSDVRAALANKTAAEAIDALRPLGDARKSCLLVTRADAGGVPALSIWDMRTYGPGVVAYFDGSAWRAVAFPLADGSNGRDAFLWRELRVLREGGDVLLFATIYGYAVCRSGCGGIGPSQGSAALWRLTDTAEYLTRSTGGDAYVARTLSNERVIEATIATPDPDPVHASLTPVNERPFLFLQQTIWERRGATLVRAASRLYASPIRTIDLFVGALEKRDRASALRLADPSVYDGWGGNVADLLPLTDTTDLLVADSQEAAYWDALPADARGPDPVTAVTAASDAYRISLARVGGDWKVSSITRR